jgi:hypothetical protein
MNSKAGVWEMGKNALEENVCTFWTLEIKTLLIYAMIVWTLDPISGPRCELALSIGPNRVSCLPESGEFGLRNV